MSSAAYQTFLSAVCLVPQVSIVMFFESWHQERGHKNEVLNKFMKIQIIQSFKRKLWQRSIYIPRVVHEDAFVHLIEVEVLPWFEIHCKSRVV
jgi:hypothetical protein